MLICYNKLAPGVRSVCILCAGGGWVRACVGGCVRACMRCACGVCVCVRAFVCVGGCGRVGGWVGVGVGVCGIRYVCVVCVYIQLNMYWY